MSISDWFTSPGGLVLLPYRNMMAFEKESFLVDGLLVEHNNLTECLSDIRQAFNLTSKRTFPRPDEFIWVKINVIYEKKIFEVFFDVALNFAYCEDEEAVFLENHGFEWDEDEERWTL